MGNLEGTIGRRHQRGSGNEVDRDGRREGGVGCGRFYDG